MFKSENIQNINSIKLQPDAKELLAEFIVESGDVIYYDINNDQFELAKEKTEMKVYDSFDMFCLLASLNLLNAAIKKNEFKKKVFYNDIKGHIARVISFCIKYNKSHLFEDFYINPEENCAYVRVFNLQFSFHNIGKNDVIQDFVDSKQNVIKTWDEIRLQPIAPIIFDLAIDLKFKSMYL